MSFSQPKQSSLQTDEQIAAKAAEWLVLLDEDSDEQLQDQFYLWLALDLRHQAAVDRMQKLITDVETLVDHYPNKKIPKIILDQGLNSSKNDTFLRGLKFVLASLFIISTGMMATFLYAPLSYWAADIRSSSQIWRQDYLSDESQIKISGKSAYNVKFDYDQRSVELIQGNILVNVAKDAHRPFIVKTAYGEIRALGTRFIVSQENEHTTLTMLESKVEVKSNQLAKQQLLVQAGQQVKINKNGLIEKTVTPINTELYEAAWNKQILLANGESLIDVLDYLAFYYDGKIVFDREQLRNYKVTATLSLIDVEHTIELLTKELNLEMQTPLPLYIKISKKS